MKALNIIVEAAKSYYDEAFNLLIMCAVTLLSCLLILPAPFAFAGLWGAGQRAVRGYGIKWHHYWAGVQEYGWRNLILILVLILGYAIGFINLWFYNTPDISPLPTSVSQWLTPIWLVLILLWTSIAFYANALLVELEEPKLLIILRNSLFLSILHPLTTFILLILTMLLLGLSFFLPVLILVTPAMILMLRLTAVRTLVQAAFAQSAAESKAKATDNDRAERLPDTPPPNTLNE